ncbi:nitrate reductase, partial [Vibrio anguillarum]|nr:nitrate reductase [Vibrio anguillarum]
FTVCFLSSAVRCQPLSRALYASGCFSVVLSLN